MNLIYYNVKLDPLYRIGIEGINLIKHFKSVSKIKSASLDELMSVKGIDLKTAQNIMRFYGNFE